MNIKFNLLSLNNKKLDKHPRSWVCIKGKEIKEIVSEIENIIIFNNKTNRERLSKIIAKELNCNFVSIKNLLRFGRN